MRELQNLKKTCITRVHNMDINNDAQTENDPINSTMRQIRASCTSTSIDLQLASLIHQSFIQKHVEQI